MKKIMVAVLIFAVLGGTAFTAVKNQQPKGKAGICCNKPSREKPGKKATAPMHYLPVVNFF